jgi:hypothetical protein
MWWHTVTHGMGSEEKTGEWSGYPVLFILPRNMVYPALLPLMRTTRLSVVDWTEAPAYLNGLVHFAERRNLASARVPSHFNWSLPCFVKGCHLIKKLKYGQNEHKIKYLLLSVLCKKGCVKNRLYAMFRNQMAELYSVKAQGVSKRSCKITPRHVEQTLDTIWDVHGKQMRWSRRYNVVLSKRKGKD